MRLTPAELKVMTLLWDQGAMTPVQLQERFPEPIKNPALRSILTVLLEKGHVRRDKAGRAFEYRPITPRHRAYSSMLRELVDAFCEGSRKQLLLNLVREQRLSPADIELLQQAAQQTESRHPPKSKSSAKQNPRRTRQ